MGRWLIALLRLPASLLFFRRRLNLCLLVDVSDLRQRLNRSPDVLVLDVRTIDEYHGSLGHIPGARNIAVEDLHRRLPELEPHRDWLVAVVCRTDQRSAKAVRLLKRAGFGKVVVVKGGMEQWNQHGLPIEI